MKQIIQYLDFEKTDLRVGKIISASAPVWSEKLLEFKVDFGEEIGQRTICAGIRQWFNPDNFVGKKYAFLVNLAEKQMGKSISQGMMLMAVEEEKPILIEVPSETKNGTVIR